MKTYEEMTQSVLTRAKQCRRQKKRRILQAVTVTAIFCIVLTAALLWDHNAAKQSPEAKPRLVLMCHAAEYSRQEPITENVITPLRFMIRVRDLRGITRYRDFVDILAEEAAFRSELFEESTEDGNIPDSWAARWQNEDVMITVLSKGFLYLGIDNYDQVQDMSVTTSQAGVASVTLCLHNETGGETKRGIRIGWGPSDATVEQIKKDPEMDLSQIKDTITVTVEFKDGVTETVVIDLTVDKEGFISVTHKGTTLSE